MGNFLVFYVVTGTDVHYQPILQDSGSRYVYF